MESRLTKRVVDALAAETGAEVRIWDTDVRGFGVRCRPSGEKYYFLKYRVAGRQRWATIGPHGSPWTVETARREARRLLGRIIEGGDPVGAKALERSDLTVSELCDLYFAQPVIVTNRGTAKKPSSLITDKSNIQRHIKPLIGHIRLRSLTRGDIEQLQQDIAAGRSKADVKTRKQGRAIVTGGKGTAARSVAVFAAILSFAVSRGLRADNPAKGVKLFASQKRERFLNDVEIARLGEALTDLAGKGANAVAISAIRFLILTGCRLGEVIGLQWSWVDLQGQCLRLPDSKTGAKIVPLGDPALALVQAQPRLVGCPFVFPGACGAGHIVNLSRVWHHVLEMAELPGLRLHDLRHSFASVAVNSGESLYIIGKLLGHKQARTTEIYAHLAAHPIRAAANRASSHIDTMLGTKSVSK